MTKLVIVRHGENVWNFENRFCGWTDVAMTQKGRDQTLEIAKILHANKFQFDVCHTSVLKRTIETAFIVLKELEQLWVPFVKSWRLNERSYGALQGLNKAELAIKYSKEQVDKWRWDFREKPPALAWKDKRHPRFDRRYAGIPPESLPVGESIADVYERMLPQWKRVIVPDLRKGKRILLSGHKNCLRAVIKHIEKIPDEEVPKLDIPLGVILVYEFDDHLKIVKKYHLE